MDIKNIGKFSFGELFNNENGKTCISLVCGFIIVLCGAFLVIRGGVITPVNQDLISKAIEIFLLAGAYLQLNKYIQGKSDIAGVGMTTSSITSAIADDKGQSTVVQTEVSNGTKSAEESAPVEETPKE